MIDLRSDTVTQPTAAMRRAMAEAEVGDDGYGEDPTVNRLEAAYAERVGKEAAMFVPSGTMANQIALRCLGTPGTRVLAGANAHIVVYEDSAAGTNATAQLHPIADETGRIDAAEVQSLVDAVAHHQAAVSAVCVEDTHMPSGGTPWALDDLAAVGAVGVPMHLDGARLWNSAVATGQSEAEHAAAATTVMSCLSKGLAAPVGSVLAGPADLIDRARHERKRLGGSMRQAGIVAAAGLLAMDTMVDRLADDHARARALADAVAARWPEAIDPSSVRTNVVVFRHDDTDALLAHLAAHDVVAGTLAPGVVRLMTHLDVDDAAVAAALTAIADAP